MPIVVGFIIGFLIPLFSLRFGKFMPADAGTSLSYMFHIPHLPKISQKLMRKWAKLIGNCVLSGCFSSAALWFLDDEVGDVYSLYSLSIYFFIIGLLAHIDWRTMYLPDVLTVPLLIFGFAFSQNYNESIAGAIYGYFMPTVVSAIVCRFKSDCFGGGDVKILAALGAWHGVIGVSVAIALSVVFFIFMLLIKRQKSGPYGPAICASSFIVLAFADRINEIISVLLVS